MYQLPFHPQQCLDADVFASPVSSPSDSIIIITFGLAPIFNVTEAIAWEQPEPKMRPVTSPMNADCDSQPADVTTLVPSHTVHHDSPTSSGSAVRANISPADAPPSQESPGHQMPGQSSRDARPQRNARKPTGTKQVDKFPRPNPRDRTEFSPEAMEKMVDSFDKNPYPGIDERVRLATLSGVEEGRIQVWFQNRRARSRRHRSHTPASRTSHTTMTTTAASVPSSEQSSTQPGQKKKNPGRKRWSSSSARDAKENLPPPGADESATPTLSGNAKRRRVAGPLTSERPESVRLISGSSSSEPSAFRRPAVPAVPTSAVSSSNPSKHRLHSFFVADILSASSSGPDSVVSRNLQPSSSGSAVATSSQSEASVSSTKSSGFHVASILGPTSTTTAGSETPACISSARPSTEESRPLSLESSSRHPNPFWPVSSTSSLTATPYALPTSSPFIQPLCLGSYPTPAAACPPFVSPVHLHHSDPYLHPRPSPQLTMPFQSLYVSAFSSPASSRTTPCMSTPVTAFSGPYGRASAAASSPAPFTAFPSYTSGLLSRIGLADATYSPVAGSFYSPLLPQAPVHTLPAAAAASPLTLRLGQFHADVTSNLLSPAPTKDARSSPKTSSPQSPVRSAGEAAKDCIDLNDTVFIDVEGDVSDTEKDIDVVDMRDSGLGSSVDPSL